MSVYQVTINGSFLVTLEPVSPPPPAVTLPDPAAYYPFDESLADAGENEIDMIGSGGHTYAAGKFGQGLSEGQVTPGWNYQPFAGNAVQSTAYSVSLWVKRPTFVDEGVNVFLENSVGGTAFDFLLLGDGSIAVTVGDGQVTGSVADADWHHVCWTHQSGTVRLYVDGAEVDSAAVNSSGDYKLGEGGAANVSVGGGLDDLAFVPEVLTLAQVQYLYNAGTGRPYMGA